MASGLIDIMKRAALDANEAAKYADIREGVVIKVNPIEIKISNNFILPITLLIIPKSLTDHDVEIIENEESKMITICNALKINDKVILLRAHGGKKYLVIDKI